MTSLSCESSGGQCECAPEGAICAFSTTTGTTTTLTGTTTIRSSTTVTTLNTLSSSTNSGSTSHSSSSTAADPATTSAQSSKQAVSLVSSSAIYIVGGVLGFLLLIAVIVIVVLLLRGPRRVDAYHPPHASAPYQSLPKEVVPSAYVTMVWKNFDQSCANCSKLTVETFQQPKPSNTDKDSLRRLPAAVGSNYDDLSLRAIDVPVLRPTTRSGTIITSRKHPTKIMVRRLRFFFCRFVICLLRSVGAKHHSANCAKQTRRSARATRQNGIE